MTCRRLPPDAIPGGADLPAVSLVPAPGGAFSRIRIQRIPAPSVWRDRWGRPRRAGPGGRPTRGVGEPGAEPRIGPNALIQTGEALVAARGEAEARRLLALAGFPDLLDDPPAAMRPEAEFLELVDFLARILPAEALQDTLDEAGRRTGAYVLRHRIPRAARLALHLLPAEPRLRVFLVAVERHAWTFAGSGSFRREIGPRGCLIGLDHGPAGQASRSPRALAAFHLGAFEILLQEAVDPRIRLLPPGGQDLPPRAGWRRLVGFSGESP